MLRSSAIAARARADDRRLLAHRHLPVAEDHCRIPELASGCARLAGTGNRCESDGVDFARTAPSWVSVADAASGPEDRGGAVARERDLRSWAVPSLCRRARRAESLEELTWISREEGSATRSLADTTMARLGIVPRRRLQLPSYEAVVHALKSGYGIAAMNRYVVAEELRAGSLTVIAIRGWNVRSVLSVLRARDARVTPLADEFQALVRKRFNEIAQDRARKEEPASRRNDVRDGSASVVTLQSCRVRFTSRDRLFSSDKPVGPGSAKIRRSRG